MATEMLELERCQERVETSPESAAAHFNLGLAYTQRGMVDRAEASYRKALEADPDLVQAWVNLGGVLMLKWDFKGSLEANREALKLKDDLVMAHYNTCQAHLYLGDAEGVIHASRRVLELDPGHAAGCYFHAVGLLAAGRVEEARVTAERATALGHSPAPDFLRALGNAEKTIENENNGNDNSDIGADAPTQQNRR
jgi:tetratricopeptide (TPR) repeat protein